MIDLTTGKIELDGVEIEPTFSIDDFRKYLLEKVTITEPEDRYYIIRFNTPVKCNKIYAEIKIEINENQKERKIIITPSSKKFSNLNILDLSKQWLKDMSSGEYHEDKYAISGSYKWGYINAQPKDHDAKDGEIIITYR